MGAGAEEERQMRWPARAFYAIVAAGHWLRKKRGLEGSMFHRNYWEVLLVDDEPDILAVSRLALRGLTVYGVPIKIHECSSKEQAIKFLRSTDTSPYIDLAIIDVVMETDSAGLDLCHYIRRQLCNEMTQLVVRTGQAGLAPEPAVTDEYDINAYLTKVEATDTKLYACVKAALRQSLYARTHEMLLGWSRHLAEARSFAGLLKVSRAALWQLCEHETERTSKSVEGHCALIIGDDVVGLGSYESPEQAFELRRQLASAQGVTMNPAGDVLVREGKRCALRLAEDKRHKTHVEIVGEINFEPPPAFWIRGYLEVMRCLRAMTTVLPPRRTMVLPDPAKRAGYV